MFIVMVLGKDPFCCVLGDNQCPPTTTCPLICSWVVGAQLTLYHSQEESKKKRKKKEKEDESSVIRELTSLRGNMVGLGGPHQAGVQVREGKSQASQASVCLRISWSSIKRLFQWMWVRLRLCLSNKLLGDDLAMDPLPAPWVARTGTLIPWGQEGCLCHGAWKNTLISMFLPRSPGRVVASLLWACLSWSCPPVNTKRFKHQSSISVCHPLKWTS